MEKSVDIDETRRKRPKGAENIKEKKETVLTSANSTSADYYFDSYSHFGIHEDMLKDEVRTKSYMNAIMRNPELFADKVVLDVGCGTGILSMFAARAGAKKVYAVDYSSIADFCKQIVIDNGLDGTIEVIRGKMEDIELPVKVDIIISEWMGYFLLYESMLDTVLYARDKYLKPEGLIFPDRAVLYLTSIEDADYKESKIGFWNDVYGFDMQAIGKVALTEPIVDVVDPAFINSDYRPILALDLMTCTKADLNFSVPFHLNFTREDTSHALVAHFDCEFSKAKPSITLSTSPYSIPTHWKQTVFYLKEPLHVCKGDKVRGTISCSPNARNNRDLDIAIDYSFEGENMQTNGIVSQQYKLR